MSKLVVCYLHTSPLLLSSVQRHKDGTVASGEIENGLWWFKREAGVGYAYRHSSSPDFVNSWPDKNYTEHPVTSTKGDYNDIINRTREENLA